MTPTGHGLGRRRSRTMDHVSRRRFAAVAPVAVPFVDRRLDLPEQYRLWYDQGQEGECVGFSLSWMMSILNRRKYAAHTLYLEAQARDGYPDDDGGTTVEAGCWVLEHLGHWRFLRGLQRLVSLADGITSVRWATSVDEIRTAISLGVPVTIGINWYSNFDNPKWEGAKVGGGWWIGRGGLGHVRGGHAICVYAASDPKSAVKLVNSWGADYPPVWLPYDTLGRLLDEDGEAALVVDAVAKP